MKKSTMTALFFLLSAALALAQQPVDPVIGPSGIKQATAAGVTFEWRIAGSSLEIGLKAQTTGWIAVGFDPEVMMKGADFVMGCVKDGQTIVSDQFGTRMTGHAPDSTLGGRDDVSGVSGKEENGVTEIHFVIPLDSGDQYDKPLGAGRHTVLLARGNTDDFASRHAERAKLLLDL